MIIRRFREVAFPVIDPWKNVGDCFEGRFLVVCSTEDLDGRPGKPVAAWSSDDYDGIVLTYLPGVMLGLLEERAENMRDWVRITRLPNAHGRRSYQIDPLRNHGLSLEPAEDDSSTRILQ